MLTCEWQMHGKLFFSFPSKYNVYVWNLDMHEHMNAWMHDGKPFWFLYFLFFLFLYFSFLPFLESIYFLWNHQIHVCFRFLFFFFSFFIFNTLFPKNGDVTNSETQFQNHVYMLDLSFFNIDARLLDYGLVTSWGICEKNIGRDWDSLVYVASHNFLQEVNIMNIMMRHMWDHKAAPILVYGERIYECYGEKLMLDQKVALVLCMEKNFEYGKDRPNGSFFLCLLLVN